MTPTMQDTRIANLLLDIKAVKINVNEPFLWTSGIKSPIYCDCRIINSHVLVRDVVIEKFTELIKNEFISTTDYIAGVASGGISYGALIADRLHLPFMYVRDKKKEHGLGKQIEGEYNAYNRVILIEDLISTGGSSLKAVQAVREADLIVECLLSIMTYNSKKADNSFAEANVKHYSLCNLDIIIEVALDRNDISHSDAETILKFRETVF
jgi:orotate phosphoribosyltransferase